MDDLTDFHGSGWSSPVDVEKTLESPGSAEVKQEDAK